VTPDPARILVKLRRSDHLCPNFQAALDVLARPWNGLIMATLAEVESLRFSALREQLAAMGDRMLSLRLKELETRGLVERRVSPGPPVKVDYALTELGDETRHSTMFSLMLDKLDRGPYAFNPVDRFATDLLRAFSTEPLAYVAVLFVEEMFDALQRYGLRDETVQPLCRQTFRIHVVEEARHMRFARDELFRLIPRLPRVRREALAGVVAIGVGLVSRSMRTPQMYADAGLDVKEAMRAARTNPNGRAVLQECIDRFVPVYDELGLVTPASRALWRAQGWTV